MKSHEDVLRAGIEVRERLERFVARRVGNRCHAEDLVQEVFVRLHENMEGIKQPERVVPWLFQVTRNVIADYYRARSRRRAIARAAERDPTFGAAITGDVDQLGADREQTHAELAGCIRPLLHGLPEHYREAIELVELGAWTQAAAADEVGLSVSGMKSRVQRGRRMLRERLLACCHVTLSAASTVVDYEIRGDGPCGGSRGSNGQVTPGASCCARE